MRTTSRGLFAALALTPLLAGCFVPGEGGQRIMWAEAEILRTDAVVPLVHEKVVQGIGTKVEDVLLDPRERSLIDVDTHLK